MVCLYDEKDFEAVAHFWYEAQRVALPNLWARRFYTGKFGMNLPHESGSGVEYHWRGA